MQKKNADLEYKQNICELKATLVSCLFWLTHAMFVFSLVSDKRKNVRTVSSACIFDFLLRKKFKQNLTATDYDIILYRKISHHFSIN